MKKVVGILTMMVLVVFTAQLSAQAAEGARLKKGKDQKENRLNDLQKLKTDLALSDEQVTKIKALVDQRKANASGNKDMDKQERKDNMKKFNSELKTILNEEQYNKLNANRKDRMKKRKENKDPK